MYFDWYIQLREQTKHVKQQLGQMLRNNTTTDTITSANQTLHTSSWRDVVYKKDNGDKEDETDEK